MFISAKNSALALALLLAGCAVGPDFKRPAAPQTTGYGKDVAATVNADGVAQSLVAGANVPADWWRLFQSPPLDALVRQGIAQSPTLAAAESNLRQAQDNLRAGYGVFLPQAGAEFGATRERQSPLAFGEKGTAQQFDLFTLSGTISYTLDIWGGERRQVEALAAARDVQQNTQRAAYLTLASNIADAAIAEAAYNAELQATESIIDLQTRQLRLGEVQSTAGTAPYATVLTLQTQLQATRATIPALREKLRQTQDLLAMLTGNLPADAALPQISFADLALPHDLPVSLPSALVAQRPDILIAEASMHQASAEIGVATAAMLPNITLSGDLGSEGNSISNIVSSKGEFWSLGADMVQPLFQGGTLYYRRKAAIDAYQATAANYRQTVLAAFQQVADTLGAVQHDAETLQAEEMALSSARRALQLTQANYQSGIASGTDLLIAEAAFQQATIAEIAARAQRYQDNVALFAALGGGWWNQGVAAN